MFPFLTVLVALPAVGALVLWLLPDSARGRAREIALGIAVVELAVVVAAVTQFDAGAAGFQLSETYAWIPQIGASWALGVNGISLTLVALSALLVPAVLLAEWKIDGEDAARRTHYVALILLLQAFMVGIFLARDVFLFYVLFEAMLIPLYFMIGIFGGEQRRYAAVKFLLYSLAGGLIMLVAVVALYFVGPGGEQAYLTDNLTGLELGVWAERLMFLAFFLAFAIKAPMVPVHTWLPTVAQTARPGTTTLLVAVLDKVGTFGMLTLCLALFPAASAWAAPVIIPLAVVSVLYGALLAIGQQNILRLIAYTSVSHFGIMVLGIFVFQGLAASGAAFYQVNHGLSTGALFLLAGMLIARRGSAEIADFGGLQKVTPVMAGAFLIVGLSSLALPGLSPFVSEIMVFIGAYGPAPWAVLFAVPGVVLAAVYILVTYQRAFTGPAADAVAEFRDMDLREKLAVWPLVAIMLVLGVVPTLALTILDGPSRALVDYVLEATS